MALFKQKKRTPQAKAHRAQLGIFARLIGCAYLIYLMVQIIQTTLAEESEANTTGKIAIATVFLAVSLGVIILTIIEFLKSYKAGLYNAAAYSDDFAGDETDAPGIGDAGEAVNTDKDAADADEAVDDDKDGDTEVRDGPEE